MAGLTVARRGMWDGRGERTIPRQVPGVPRVVNVTDPVYGAVGDGGSDDTAKIQAAIDTLGTSGVSGGIVFFPHTGGAYRVTAALTIYQHVRLVGEQTRQSGASLIQADPAGSFTNGPISDKYILKQAGATNTNYWHGGGIEHLSIDCNNVAGLGGAHLWQPGENCKIDFVRVDNAGSTARTVTDMVTNSTTTITSATAAFTADDVNALVTAGGDIPASTKVDRVTNGTTAVLSNAATGSHSGQTLTLNRPADAVVFDGGAPTGYIRSLNGINNAGALLRLKNMASGSFLIESLSGDSNGGGLLRVSAAAAAGDPMSVTVVNFKAENPGAVTAMDPVVLLDGCDMVALNVLGGSAIDSFTGRDVVRIDQPVTTRGGPSVNLVGIEGANPFNTQYTNIIRDTSTGKLIPSTASTRFYPDVLWGRNLLMGGSGTIQQNTAAPAYSASITPDASAAPWQTITVTNTTAFTINAPTNPPGSTSSAELTIEVLNSSGGAMGAITWNAAFVFATGAWANPANGKKRFARFEWNGANWIATSVASADY